MLLSLRESTNTVSRPFGVSQAEEELARPRSQQRRQKKNREEAERITNHFFFEESEEEIPIDR